MEEVLIIVQTAKNNWQFYFVMIKSNVEVDIYEDRQSIRNI